MLPVTSYDVLVVVAISFGIQITGVVVLGIVLGRMLAESQRLTRAVAGLVIQEEEEKTRALFRRS